MDILRFLDSSLEYMSLDNLYELCDYGLHIAIIGKVKEDADISHLPNTQISSTGCTAFTLIFESYIAYNVTDESHSCLIESEQYSGKLIRSYTDSMYLSFIESSTLATYDYSGPYSHYGIACLDHIIDVVSTDRPMVKPHVIP